MSSFAENLAQLPSVADLQALELYGDGYEPIAVIENVPGSQGALTVYYHVAIEFGGLTPKAAEQALELFAEHTDDARLHPGAHPNIDRLFQIIDQDLYYSVKAIPKTA